MAFESLTERLQNVLKNLRRKENLHQRMSRGSKGSKPLLPPFPVVKTIKRVREQAVGHEVMK